MATHSGFALGWSRAIRGGPALVLAASVALAGCKGKAEVKASADVDLRGKGSLEGEPAPSWDDETTGQAPEGAAGPHPAREIEASARWVGPPTATYPGFQIFEDGTSRVFLEVAGGSVAVKGTQENGVYRYRFEGVRVPERVNRLPMPTGHFETPVSLVEVSQIGDDAELVIHVRGGVSAQPRVKRNEAGTVLSVDFPLEAPDQPELTPSGPRGAPPPRASSIEEEVPSEVSSATPPPAPSGSSEDSSESDELSTRR